jgi:N-acetylglucosaminyldiphosphoundecaprenol N-acetyl-beta-D-mannosaminyltransferase
MTFCNISFSLLSKKEIFCDDSIQHETKIIIPTNASLIVLANKNKRFMEILNKCYVTFDGTIPFLFAKMFTKKGIAKMSGSDLIYDFCEYAQSKKLKLFVLGGDKKYNTRAVEKLRIAYPSLYIDGFSPPCEVYPVSDIFTQLCFERINKYKPDILFVAFGAPKQEYWIDDNRKVFFELGVKYIVACGGTIDFVAGKVTRAPEIIQKAGLESIYRFIKEPTIKRMERIFESLEFFRYIKCKKSHNKIKK